MAQVTILISRIGAQIKSARALKAYLLLAMLGAFWALLRRTDGALLPDQIYWSYFPLVCLSVLLFWAVLALVWRFNLSLTLDRKIGYWSAFRQVVMLLMGKYLPGKVWGVFARGGDASMRDQVPASSSYAAAYLEQLISVHAGVMFGLGLVSVSRPTEHWLSVLFLVSLPTLLIVPRYHHLLLKGVVGGVLKKYSAVLQAIDETGISVFDYWWLFLAYLCEWLVTGLMLVTVYLVLTGTWPESQLFLLLLGSYAIAMVVGFVAFFAPGGIGVREGVMTALLASAMGLESAVVLAMVMRIVSVIADLVAGVLAWAIAARSP